MDSKTNTVPTSGRATCSSGTNSPFLEYRLYRGCGGIGTLPHSVGTISEDTSILSSQLPFNGSMEKEMIVCGTQFARRFKRLGERHRNGTKAGDSPSPRSPYSAASDHDHANAHRCSCPPSLLRRQTLPNAIQSVKIVMLLLPGKRDLTQLQSWQPISFL